MPRLSTSRALLADGWRRLRCDDIRLGSRDLLLSAQGRAVSNHDNRRRGDKKRTETGAKSDEGGCCGSRRNKMYARRARKRRRNKKARRAISVASEGE